MENTGEEHHIRLVEELLKCGTVINKISEALSILVEKRATLEEKMIKSYFIRLASAHSKAFEKLLEVMADGEAQLPERTLSDLASVAERANTMIDKFLKAAKYNLNYLEQYFEHQFASELERDGLLEDSLKVFASLSESALRANCGGLRQADTE